MKSARWALHPAILNKSYVRTIRNYVGERTNKAKIARLVISYDRFMLEKYSEIQIILASMIPELRKK